MSDFKEPKQAKLVDSKWIDVKVTYRDPNNETPIVKVGGNHVIINGKMTIKHYTMKVDEIVNLPEPFVKDLQSRSHVIKGKKGIPQKVPILSVEIV